MLIIEKRSGRNAVPLISISILFLVAFAPYLNALSDGFVYDDNVQVVGNFWIRDIRHVFDVFSANVAGFSTGYATSYYRPLMYVAYMVDYQLFGLHAWGFHLVNILFHFGSSILVFFIASRLFETEVPPDTRLLSDKALCRQIVSPPFVAALLFAVHPVHTEAVTWIAGLPELTYTFFFLLSFYFYLSLGPESGKRYLFSAIAFFLATLCKEPAVMLPVLLVAYDYEPGKEMRPLRFLKQYAPYFLSLGFYLIIRLVVLGDFAPSRRHGELSAFQLVINIFPLFVRYLETLVLPVNLSALHVFSPVRSILEGRSMVSLGVSALFFLLVFISRRKNKAVFLGLVLIVIPLLPALYIPALGENVFAERYLYLPSFGFVLLAGSLVSRISARRAVAAAAIVVSLAGLYSAGTIMRNPVWKDNYSLWADAVSKSPDSVSAHEYFGYALYERGLLDKAIEQYRLALMLDPARTDAHVNLGLAYFSKGWLEGAVREYQAALTLSPGDVEAHDNLGLAYAGMGLNDKAIEQHLAALRLNPEYANAHNNLGAAYANSGMMDKAVEHFREAVRLRPDNETFRENLSRAYGAKSARESGIAHD